MDFAIQCCVPGLNTALRGTFSSVQFSSIMRVIVSLSYTVLLRGTIYDIVIRSIALRSPATSIFYAGHYIVVPRTTECGRRLIT